jgi:HrpA-like RNA helicase
MGLSATPEERRLGGARNVSDVVQRARDLKDSIAARQLPGVGCVRDRLPVDEYERTITQHIRTHPVTCIRGETGCGKSSGVPQMILREAASRDEVATIIVTQPRRIAAITLAQRVSAEHKTAVGDVIGYAIGQESEHSRRTRILFVTTGYLLQLLSHNPGQMARFTHVVLDEIHERWPILHGLL